MVQITGDSVTLKIPIGIVRYAPHSKLNAVTRFEITKRARQRPIAMAFVGLGLVAYAELIPHVARFHLYAGIFIFLLYGAQYIRMQSAIAATIDGDEVRIFSHPLAKALAFRLSEIASVTGADSFCTLTMHDGRKQIVWLGLVSNEDRARLVEILTPRAM